MTAEAINPAANRATVLFVCLHGGAKSLIAAEYFNHLARERGVALGAESAGLEPYAEVPAPVIAGLARAGFDVHEYVPRQLSTAQVTDAAHIVTFECELPTAMPDLQIERWNDVPMVSDDFQRARDEIVSRVSQLVDKLARVSTTDTNGTHLRGMK